jgi:hypothetical protein
MTTPKTLQISLMAETSDTTKMHINRMKVIRGVVFVAIVIATALSSAVQAELYINEIYWDPPANPDTPREYIELRGTPGTTLANHYLIFLENEDRAVHLGATGEIESFFDLNGKSIGLNGFMTLRQKNSPFAVDSGANSYVNTSSFGNGWGSDPASSSIGVWDQGGEGEMENSGFTVMLIRNDGVPMTTSQQHFALLGEDLDVGNDGLDHLVTDDGPFWKIVNQAANRNWTILDSIGVYGEAGEAGLGRTYGRINFGQELPGQLLDPEDGGVWDPELGNYIFVPRIEPGATYVGVDYEIELAARWGNSIGQASADWHVTNITDEVGSGSQNTTDLRQSCIDAGGVTCHPADDANINTPPPLGLPTESNWGVPYGTQLIDNLGRPNFMLGDYNDNGFVDAADYTVWRDMLSGSANDLADHPADANHDYIVNELDYEVWKAHYGEPGFARSAGGAAYIAPLRSSSVGTVRGVPEPNSLSLLAFCTLSFGNFRFGSSRRLKA